MRKSRILFAGALAVVLAMSVSAVALAITPIQTLDVEVGGKEKPKFDKKKFKKTSIKVTTTTADADNPNGMPPKANHAQIRFSKKNLKFAPDSQPKCDPNAIENTTTEAAKAACGNAQVGEGDAIAALPFGAGGTRQDFPAVVTAFNNGADKGILLHSRVNALGTTVVLPGKLSGTTLDVDVPPLGGGVGAIARFYTAVKAGKYIQARCKQKQIKNDSTFTYNDAPAADAADSQKCKQKKKKKKGGK